MAKNKNKNKNKNSQSNKDVNSQAKVVTNLTQEQVDKITAFSTEEMPLEAFEIPNEELIDTKEDAQKAEDIKKNGNVDGYISKLHDMLLRIKAIEKRAEEIKERHSQDQATLATDKKAFDDYKKEEEKKLETERKRNNDRQKKLDEEKMAIDNGEYSTVIKSLLDSMRSTEEEITNSTKTLVEDMGKKHESYINSLAELNKKKDALDEQNLQLEADKAELERKRKLFESSKTSAEKRIRQEIEDEYDDKINELEDENFSLKSKTSKLEKENKSLSDFKRELMSAFESLDAEMMIKEQNNLKEECQKLKAELDLRHPNEDYEVMANKVTVLEAKIREMEDKVSEEKLSELRLSLHNADAYILEINTYKALIDSAKAREGSLLRTVADLHKTIDQLNDAEKAKQSVFEQTKHMDEDPELANRKFRWYHPNTLNELVEYLQRHMANAANRKPFYYDQKTIRIFMAGLNMSLLSILQGISGTGKTSLPREIAKALVAGAEGYTGKDSNGNRNEPYRICAIQSGWRDNMDLMGFYNNFEKKYKETDFFKALYLAAQPKYQNTLFLIILDEMNLSHPEHYFADFLSMMEQSIDDRYIKINADEELLPKLFKGRQMQLPPNVRFIGTANHDETTLDFAPKTYDRSNVMVMSTNDMNKVTKEIQSAKYVNPTSQDKLSVDYTWLKTQFDDAEKQYNYRYEEFDKFIKTKNLCNLLNDRGIGIGNRFDEQARKFICAYIALGENSTECLAEAADHLITSRLFRSLKNRYDLTADNLEDFHKKYNTLFADAFKGQEPIEGNKLLNAEISKK
jgi:hypothetical protein